MLDARSGSLRIALIGGALALGVATLVSLFVWMVPLASAREGRAACTGMRPSASVPALCNGAADCALPKPAPDFEVRTIDNQVRRLSDFRGQVVLLNFWASWCGTCKAEKASLDTMAGDLTTDGLVVLTVASDDDWAKVLMSIAIAHRPHVVPADFLTGPNGEPAARIPTLPEALEAYGRAMPEGTNYQVMIDPPQDDGSMGPVAQRYGVSKVPESFLIDRQGMVRQYFVNKRDWQLDVFATCARTLIDE